MSDTVEKVEKEIIQEVEETKEIEEKEELENKKKAKKKKLQIHVYSGAHPLQVAGLR